MKRRVQVSRTETQKRRQLWKKSKRPMALVSDFKSIVRLFPALERKGQRREKGIINTLCSLDSERQAGRPIQM